MTLGHDRRVVALGVLAVAPGLAVAVWVGWEGGWRSLGGVLVGVAVAASIVALAAVRREVARPLETLTNVVAALREDDFSVRYHASGRPGDPLDQLAREINTLSSTLRTQRLGAAEATALLRQVMEEIDVAVFSFDGDSQVRLVNRAAERLLGRSREELLGRRAEEAGVGEFLAGAAPRVFDGAFPGGAGRYELRRGTFRQEGLPQRLVVLSNLSQALREEERQAWQRLIRVLGHELNNSLATIKSISTSLEAIAQPPIAPDHAEDLRHGLGVIRGRAESLARFMEGYTRLARLPSPQPRPLDVRTMIERVVRLETRVPVDVAGGSTVAVQADADQIEQILINLLRNAAEAALETRGGVSVSWTTFDAGAVEIRIDDAGPGLPAAANLFVPFFTTKPNGSGIGLVLSRQIAESHGGSLLLEARRDGPGCRARLRLPAAVAAGGTS